MDDFTSRVSLAKVAEDNGITVVYSPEDPHEIMLSSSDVNRPGLVLGAGFFDHFEPRRIQIIGNAEAMFLKKLPDELRRERLTDFLRHHPAAVIVTHRNEVDPVLLELASYFEVPVLSTEENTSDFMATLISYLHVQLAPQITRHGVFVEVYGEGILITGDSGVGKSETAIELIKRGHRLIADDAVELRRVSAKSIIGSAPELIRHYIELRGIGIVDVRRLFGMGSVKLTEKIDLVVHLEPWSEDVVYDRMGMETEYTSILGINVPSVTIPVKPGRNLAIIVEVAAMNNRQKKLGYNAAAELDAKITRGSREAQMLSEMNEV